MRVHVLSFLLIGSSSLPSAVLAAQGALPAPMEACTLAGGVAARCGSIEVWENREARGGRKIALRVAVLPASGAATDDPVVVLAGGPGQATLPLAGMAAQELAGIRDTRDIVLVDVRGAGQSNPLACNLYGPGVMQMLGGFMSGDRVRECAREWSQKADVSQYTTDATVDDLDEVRQALGYARVNLYGTSYGTRAALVYLRRHPDRVRSVILHGVVHTGIRMPSRLAEDSEGALRGVLDECEREPACAAAFPRMREGMRVADRMFAAGPVQVAVTDPGTGDALTIPLSRDLFVEGLRYMLYSADRSSLVPAVLQQAAEGDLSPAAEAAIFSRRGLLSDMAAGLYLSVTCAEDVPFIDVPRAVAAARGTFMGDSRLRAQIDGCAAWPVRPVAASWLEPVRSDVPVLMITGTLDPATPSRQAEEALRTLPNGRSLLVPSAGHGYGGLTGVRECIPKLMQQFILTADAKRLDASCLGAIRRPPFPTRAISAKPVSLDSATLAGYAGTYADSAGQMRVEARVENGRLRMKAFGRDFLLVPVGSGTFRIVGAPAVTLTFAPQAGAAMLLTVEEPGQPTYRMTRP